MTTTLSQALAIRAAEQARADIFTELAGVGIDATGWDDRSVHRALVELDARARSKGDAIRADLVRAGFLDTAALAGDEWVDRLALGFYNLTRMPSTRAIHTVRFTNNASGGPYPLNLGQVQALAGLGSGVVSFRNSEVRTLAAGAGKFVDVQFTADLGGLVGNVPIGAINRLATGLPGVTVASTELVKAGAEAESNANLVARCRARWSAGSAGGSRDAFIQWIAEAFLAQSLTSTLTKYRLDDSNPNGPGSVDLYLASDAGPATLTELGIVDPYIQKRKTLGTGFWRSLAAIPFIYSVDVTIFAANNPNATTDAAIALSNVAASVPLGGTLYFAELVAALMAVRGATNVVVPPGDIQLLPSQVLEIAGTISAG
jgi:uncharacterized phage protein gp47/JayE